MANELGHVGYYPRAGSSFLHEEKETSPHFDNNGLESFFRREDEEDTIRSESEELDLQWKEHREYENRRLQDAAKLLDSPSSSTTDTPLKPNGNNKTSTNSLRDEEGILLDEQIKQHPQTPSPMKGRSISPERISFVERANAFKNARDSKVQELAKELEQKSMLGATFQPKVNNNASSPRGAPRGIANRAKVHQENKNEKLANLAAQHKLQQDSNMRARPRLYSKQQSPDKTPVVERLWSAGERSKQKRDALRKSLDEMDSADGKLLFHPRLHPRRASPPPDSPKLLTKLYGEATNDGHPRLYREVKARQKRAEDRRREADRALADAAISATRQNSKSVELNRRRLSDNLNHLFRLFLDSLDSSVSLSRSDQYDQHESSRTLVYLHIYSSTLHLIRSQHLEVKQPSRFNDEKTAALVAQIVWQQLQGEVKWTGSREISLEVWLRFATKINREAGGSAKENGHIAKIIDINELCCDLSPVLGDIVAVVSSEEVPPPPPQQQNLANMPARSVEPNLQGLLCEADEVETVVLDHGGVSTKPIIPKKLEIGQRKATCCAFVAAGIAWVDQIRSEKAITGALATATAARERETQTCTFSPAINAKSRSMDNERMANLMNVRESGDGLVPFDLGDAIPPSRQHLREKHSRHQQMLDKHKQAKAILMQKRAIKDEEEMKGATFKPETRPLPAYLKKNRHLGHPTDPAGSKRADGRKVPVHLRLYKQANSNEAFLAAERKKLMDKELDGCTFQPDRVTKRTHKNGRSAWTGAREKMDTAVTDHIARIQAAKEKKDQLKRIQNQANVYNDETYQKSQTDKEVVPFELATGRRKSDREKNAPMLFLDVNFGPSKKGRIGIAAGDSAIELAETFVAVHSLRQAGVVEKLTSLIQMTAKGNGIHIK